MNSNVKPVCEMTWSIPILTKNQPGPIHLKRKSKMFVWSRCTTSVRTPGTSEGFGPLKGFNSIILVATIKRAILD